MAVESSGFNGVLSIGRIETGMEIGIYKLGFDKVSKFRADPSSKLGYRALGCLMSG